MFVRSYGLSRAKSGLELLTLAFRLLPFTLPVVLNNSAPAYRYCFIVPKLFVVAGLVPSVSFHTTRTHLLLLRFRNAYQGWEYNRPSNKCFLLIDNYLLFRSLLRHPFIAHCLPPLSICMALQLHVEQQPVSFAWDVSPLVCILSITVSLAPDTAQCLPCSLYQQ